MSQTPPEQPQGAPGPQGQPQQPGQPGQPGQQPGQPGQPGQQPGQPWQGGQGQPQQPYPGQQPQQPYPGQHPQQGAQQGAQQPYGQKPAWQQPGQPAGQHGQPAYGQPYAQGHSPAVTAPKPPATGFTRIIGLALIVFAILIAIGSFGTWVTSDIFDRAGLGAVTWHDSALEALVSEEPGAADGVITLVLAVLLLVPGVLRVLGKAPRAMAIVAVFPALLVALVGLVDVLDVTGTDEALIGDASVGWGLWLVFVSGILATVTAVVGIIKAR